MSITIVVIKPRRLSGRHSPSQPRQDGKYEDQDDR